MSTSQIEFTRVRHWLERKVRARAAANLTIAVTHVILGLLLVTGTAWFLAWLILLGFEQFVAVARHNFGVALRYQHSTSSAVLLGALFLVALFVGNARSTAINLSQFGKINWRSRAGSFATLGLLGGLCTRLLYLGPHLLNLAAGFFRQWLQWKRLDREVVAEVLHLLAAEGRRVAYDEIARRIRGFTHSRTVPQLQLFDGILFLTSPPTGLSLTSTLREEMTGRRWPHDPREPAPPRNPGPDPANRIRGRRVVFLCGGCSLKLRVLIASENISIQCPRCRATYRVVGVENGRIQMQRVSSGFRPRKPAAPKPPPPPPPPRPPREPFDHELLEVSRDASAEEIKAAYRKLLKENHPDFFTNAAPAELAKAEEYTKKLNQAYRSMMRRFEK